MVHALEKAHSLLKPKGVLIDIHPNGERPAVEVHVDGKAHLAGYLDETDDFVEYFEADSALVEVVDRGLFELEREGLFTFLTHATSIEALSDYLASEYSDAVLHEETIESAIDLMGEPNEGKEIVLREHARIARFRARRARIRGFDSPGRLVDHRY